MGYEKRENQRSGFTLIELSIVLVIIGLIVGGVLVGRDLISAAAVRAQITQIEKYNQAANTFRSKYAYLPGDIPDPDASKFGFAPRGPYRGQGDGNGVIESNYLNAANGATTGFPLLGESAMFWVDLSTAHLIDGSFQTANATSISTVSTGVPNSAISQYLPQAKLGIGYVYIWGRGSFTNMSWLGALNYFAVTVPAFGTGGSEGEVPSMTVAQAYAIDKKIDDGLPQYGNVIAFDNNAVWAAGGPTSGPPTSVNGEGDYNHLDFMSPALSASDLGDGGIPAGSYSCYDGSNGFPEQYSLNQNGGKGLNCWLSFKMQ